jgi:hypothetical protein
MLAGRRLHRFKELTEARVFFDETGAHQERHRFVVERGGFA